MGEATAEPIKIALGVASRPHGPEWRLQAKGRDLVNGISKENGIGEAEIADALADLVG